MAKGSKDRDKLPDRLVSHDMTNTAAAGEALTTVTEALVIRTFAAATPNR